MGGADNGVPTLTPTPATRWSRRRLLARAGALGAAAAIAAPRPATAAARFGARYQAATALTVGFTLDDAPKVQPLLDEYARANNVQFTVRASAYDEFYADLNENLTGLTGAFDVVSLDDPWIPQLAGGEFVMGLNEPFARLGVQLGDFVPELLALGDFPSGSGVRALPWVGNVQVFAWRTDVLAELGLAVPKTWDDVLGHAQAITAARGSAGTYGIGLRGVTGNAATTSFLPTLRGHGTDVFGPDSWEPILTEPAAAQAMTTHLALARLAPPGVDRVDHRANGDNMATGATAMSADIWPDQVLRIFDPAQSDVAGRVEVGPQPAQPNVPPANMSGNALLAIPRGSQNVGAALEFVLWFTAPEQQKRLLFEQNVAATRVSVLEDPEAVARFPFLPGLLAAGRNALPRPRTPLYPQVEQILGDYVAQAIVGRLDGASALQRANDDIRALMIRNGELAE